MYSNSLLINVCIRTSSEKKPYVVFIIMGVTFGTKNTQSIRVHLVSINENIRKRSHSGQRNTNLINSISVIYMGITTSSLPVQRKHNVFEFLVFINVDIGTSCNLKVQLNC